MPATRSSSSVTPTVASTTRRTTSASAMARSAWRLTWASMPSWVAIQPPVSTTRNSRPFQSASKILRSRVTPGSSSTIASRRPTMRLTRVDLPTLGRPTMATSGGACVISTARSALEGFAQRHPVGGDDLDGPRQVGRRRAVEEGALRQTDVGQQVPVALGLVVEHAGDVLADEQPGDADVPAEELVVHRKDAHVLASSLCEEGLQHPGPVLTGQHRHRRVCAMRCHFTVAVVQTRRPVALGGGAVDPGEEAGVDSGAGLFLAQQLELEGAGHADAVLVLREAFVGVSRR